MSLEKHILIIPDVHGRKFWRKPTEDMSQWDKVIFLGDYVDPYEGEATTEETVQELKDIIALKEIYKDKVILLWGNHDLFYWCKPYRDQMSYWSRHDFDHHNELESIFLQHNDLFQWAWEYDKYLFTHAGVTNGMARFIIEEYDDINAEIINKFFSQPEYQSILASVSYYRGGWNQYGSIVWADIREHYKVDPIKQMKQFYQVFGHTYAKQRIITDYWAMLDTGGGWNYIEDLKIKDPNGNEVVKTKL